MGCRLNPSVNENTEPQPPIANPLGWPSVFRWVLFIACVSGVLYAIFRPTPPEMLFDNSDKVGHFLAFGGLSLTAFIALKGRFAWVMWGSLVLLAFVLEYLQGVFLPLRTFSLEDSYANVVGVAIGFAVCQLIGRFRSR
jgi:VanZ family protein